jgi:hypothetical protein
MTPDELMAVMSAHGFASDNSPLRGLGLGFNGPQVGRFS